MSPNATALPTTNAEPVRCARRCCSATASGTTVDSTGTYLWPVASTPDTDRDRFVVETASPRGFRQAYVRANPGGVPLLAVHGWPESKRIFWKVIEPLARAGFEVIVPDLRGFGDSDIGPDGFHDVASHSRDLHALVHDHLGHDHAVLVGGDLGGPVIQDMALRFNGFASRMVLFNSPLPYDKERMVGMRTR